MRHGSPEAWAASGIILIARANDLLLPGGESVSAQLVADDLGVSVGALTSTEQQLARALNPARYRYRPTTADREQDADPLGGYTIDGFPYGRRHNPPVKDARPRPTGAP